MADTMVCRSYPKQPETGDVMTRLSHLAALASLGIGFLAVTYGLVLYLLARR